ncbi:MAG: hypothetical protein CM1200mP22_03550 [Dehalococcoidia bacterium]|nr:MAG: hypothetical protein CM1200mP22_03550 [Dehalococcoidia bacterium]
MVASVYVLSGTLTFFIGTTRATVAKKGESVFSMVGEGSVTLKVNNCFGRL